MFVYLFVCLVGRLVWFGLDFVLVRGLGVHVLVFFVFGFVLLLLFWFGLGLGFLLQRLRVLILTEAYATP